MSHILKYLAYYKYKKEPQNSSFLESTAYFEVICDQQIPVFWSYALIDVLDKSNWMFKILIYFA